ncbi:MAG: UDP-N-acetylmuramoyl-tripeptide--D-alanyl-D-alanine ligase [Bacteroidota bacterium]
MESIEMLYQIFQNHPNVITDSRKIEKGCLFFALKGERFNGNEYAQEAIEKGAAYAVIDEKKYKKGDHYFLVEDVLSTLQELANFHRRRMLVPIIAITGSNVKTTTKELMAAVLNNFYNCHHTKGNLNNHIGVPLTLLEMNAEHDVAIIEMGANQIGDIEQLCNIAEPTHGVITNIGKAHLEGFGSIEGIKKGKSELYKFIHQQQGVLFVNMEEPFLLELSEGLGKRVYYKKSKHPNQYEAPFETVLYQTHPFVQVGFYNHNFEEILRVDSHLSGGYNFNNIMTAVTIGRYFRVPPLKIKEAIEQYVPSNNRSQIIKKGSNTFFMDAYNANPTSMSNALENFKKVDATKKVAILGDMLELGAFSEEEHHRIFEKAKSLELDELILVGEAFKNTQAPLAKHFDNVEELKSWFEAQAYEHTYFLIKGSRGIKLEELLN